jgi:hypothetical protein
MGVRVTHVGEMRNASTVLVGRDHLRDIGMDRSITLKCILEKYGLILWIRFNQMRIGFSVSVL